MLPTGSGNAGERPHPPRKRRVLLWSVALVTLAAVIIAAGAIWTALTGSSSRPSSCSVASGSTQYAVEPEQAVNATTITAVGKQLGLPDHAVTIALATALQESQLHNLDYGDRDSLGLFQQRPSQGWGTPKQLMDPRYAAGAFFKALARVSDWQTRSISSAAQAVQHSNDAQAYAQWEPLARALAIATTGEIPAGLTCQFTLARSPLPAPSPIAALTTAFGVTAFGTPVPAARGWMIAGWLVAHAEQYRIVSIRFENRQWTPAGAWTADRTGEPGVQITQALPH